MTPQEKLQQEAEQLYPDVDETRDYLSDDYRINEVKKFQRAAHVACAEKYTTLLQKQSLIHHRAIVEKNKEIERLRNELSLIAGELETIEFDPPTAVKRIRNHVTNALKTTP